MNGNHVAGIAQSRYRQLRCTLTHETNGTLSYRVYAKPLNAGWSEQHLIAQGRAQSVRPILSTEDAIGVLVDLLKQEMLPGLG